MTEFTKDALRVQVYATRAEMGRAAARDIEAAIAQVLREKGRCNMIFAAAPSQNEVLAALAASKSIDWPRVHAFHMDEYIGLPAAAPQGFANFLRAALFDKVPLGSVHCIDSTAGAEAEAARYSALLRENPADIVLLGIGENGHLAFNDPHVAQFDDPALVKAVTLDDTCRMQQVHDGCFASLDEVPRTALTLTIPALMAAGQAFCVVPAPTKAQAVRRTLEGPVSPECPATALRRHPHAALYLDADSASLLARRT
ncbi:MAG TPA: glucosamine-6-phosphate deaminase [Candidatus Ruthenibacterium merdigallinarum]|nr:glucosamine-6-phosphate deaminase [Candidatus Ruthenibacterium merdigallinarum]